MQRKALALLSGGLDSTLAVKVILDQGIQVEALNFTSPFCTCTSSKNQSVGCKSEAVRVAQEFNIPIKVLHKGVEYLEIVRAAKHGYGKAMNPCIDCRIFLLRKAREYMAESGADFVITGEVLGQRPMSQRRETLRIIERESGLEGLLLRPLSARHFPPTIPEQQGWVDREKLLAMQGRSRKPQMQLAADLDVKNYPCPAGGCLLTETSFVPKVQDIFAHADQLNLRDFRLLKLGRHFRIGPRSKVIIARDEAENSLLAASVQPGETVMHWLEGGSPAGLVMGDTPDEGITIAAKILLRYTKAPADRDCLMHSSMDGTEQQFTCCNSFTEEIIEAYRIGTP